MDKNMLKLNTKKTDFLIISNKCHLAELQNTTLAIGGDVITTSSAARNLGVSFDATLSMVPHISSCCSSANHHLRNIGKTRKFLTSDATEKLIHALVTSRLDYGNSLLINTPSSHLKKLQLVQNTAARIITKTPRTSHITPVLQSLHWLPIEARIQYKVALMTFKALHDEAPSYLSSMLKTYTPSRQLRSSQQNVLTVPKYKTKQYGARCFSVAAPTLWNTLPAELRQCHSSRCFKTMLNPYSAELNCYSL